MSTPIVPMPDPGRHTPGVTDTASIELKEVEGLSQTQIVRKRFLRHRGALISMIVLSFVIVLAFTSVGVKFGDFKSGGWWPYTWNVAVDVENGGRPTLSLSLSRSGIIHSARTTSDATFSRS